MTDARAIGDLLQGGTAASKDAPPPAAKHQGPAHDFPRISAVRMALQKRQEAAEFAVSDSQSPARQRMRVRRYVPAVVASSLHSRSPTVTGARDDGLFCQQALEQLRPEPQLGSEKAT